MDTIGSKKTNITSKNKIAIEIKDGLYYPEDFEKLRRKYENEGKLFAVSIKQGKILIWKKP